MLTRMIAHDVEPMGDMDVSFRPRLNLLCGDNGLGKTFVLDLAWWGLTGTWARHEAIPRRGEGVAPTLGWEVTDGGSTSSAESVFEFGRQKWAPDRGRVPPRLVLQARHDGGFDVWDHFRRLAGNDMKRVFWAIGPWNRFTFSSEAVWNGLSGEDGTVLCNGLLRDVVTWQFQRPALFDLLARVVARLSPHPGEVLRIGQPQRVSIEDARDIPTLVLPYGTVPVTHASAGMRRVLALAYMLVWTWHEHTEAARLRNTAPLGDLVLLLDEVEAHLHPQWQRVILPALFQAITDVQSSLGVQIIATTHAPLVLASVETMFDEERDQLLHFGLSKGHITVERLPWAKQGDAVNWLVSETFGLHQARSQEAELAIEAAEAFSRGAATPPNLRTKEAIQAELLRVLPGHDEFWPRWLVETGIVK